MTYSEAGRLGGIETSVRYGPQRCPTCRHLSEKSEFHINNGKKGGGIGGRKIFKLRGREWMSQIGKLGGRGNTRERRLGIENHNPDLVEILLS